MDGDPFDLVGDVLDGQFRVDAFAGEGDLSVVYRGHHIGVDATVAIKCLNLPATLDQELVRPLVESFREASRLHYRLARGNMNIAQSIAAGQTIAPRTGGTVPYLVREWFEGHSFSTELAKRRDEGLKGRTVDETIAVLEPALDGMAYAHRHGVFHLSFSPSNLFVITQDGSRSLKVLDFGVAHAMNELEADLPDDERPSGGLRVLFPSYAAPEQLDKSVGELGGATDVYAIALVVMETLSDRIVMQGTETGALVERTLDVKRRPTPQVHGLRLARNLDLVLTRAVSRSPEKRQKDAGAFWNDFKSAARGTPSRSVVPVRGKLPTLAGVAPPPGAAGAASASIAPDAPPSLAPGPAPSLPPAPSPAPSLAPAPTASLAPAPTASLAPSPATSLAPAPVASLPPEPAPTVSARPQQIITARLPPPPAPGPAHAAPRPAETPPPIVTPAGVRRASMLPEADAGLPATTRLSPAFIAITSSTAGLLVACIVILLLTWPRTPQASPSPAARAPTAAAAAPSAPSASPSPAVAAHAPPAASAAQPSSAASATSAPTAATAPIAEGPRFPIMAAQRALDATSRDVSHCRKSTMWGVGKATVTFANDGTVDHVVIGPPFTGTATGQCVGEKMKAVHVQPFGGRPGVVVTRFFVPIR